MCLLLLYISNHPIKVMFNRTCLTFLCVYYIPGNCPTFFCLVSKYYNRARRTSFSLYIISEINWLAYALLNLLIKKPSLSHKNSSSYPFFFVLFQVSRILEGAEHSLCWTLTKKWLLATLRSTYSTTVRHPKWWLKQYQFFIGENKSFLFCSETRKMLLSKICQGWKKNFTLYGFFELYYKKQSHFLWIAL